MGVDYSGHYGFGFEVHIFSPDKEDEDFDRIEYLEDALENTDYLYFEVGSSIYSGDENELYVVLKNPMELGFDGLLKKSEELKRFLIGQDFISEDDEIDVVGGLEIW